MHRLVLLTVFLSACSSAGPFASGGGVDAIRGSQFGTDRVEDKRTRAANRILAAIAIERVTGRTVVVQSASSAP